MPGKKALFVGCSFTANCGFKPENQAIYHWPHIFCQQTEHEMVNRGIGGMSNQEIFLRTVEAVTDESYDLVVVMWSEVGRQWIYCSDGNVDNFTMLNSGLPKGFRNDADFVNAYAKLYYTHFNNRYVATKHWLLYCTALENFLKNKNIPYVFARGFDNNVDTFVNATYSNGFSNIDSLKSFLDFNNRPDDYILEKITKIQNLVKAQDQSKWLNLYSKSFKDTTIDLADDARHPGPKTNLVFASELINFYKNFNA